MNLSFIIFILILNQCELRHGYSPQCDEEWNCGYTGGQEEEDKPSSQESSSFRFFFPPGGDSAYYGRPNLPSYNTYPGISQASPYTPLNNNNYYTPFYGRYGPSGGGGQDGLDGYAGQFGYSPNNFEQQNFRTRLNKGNYEITGYLRDNKMSVESFGDGYIDPDNRPRCPIQNIDMVRSRDIYPYGNRGGGPGYPREHREGRILDEDIEIEIENSYDYNYPSVDGYNNNENYKDVQGRWFLGFNPFRQVYSNNYNRPGGGGYGGVPPSSPYPSRICNDCIWEAELVCQLSASGDGVRWTRYYDDFFYPRGRYHDILDYYGSRARIDSTDDGKMSRLIIYKVLPEDKGTYACETWSFLNEDWSSENPYNYFQGNNVQKELLTIDFYPQFPTFSTNC
uniref:Ig-like domain-containing protein n=1 Tax=Lepeophtheirus salmonis TaxID=72036 RepID=A0A0K2UFX6_LEPSM